MRSCSLVGIEESATCRRFYQWLCNRIADRASYRLDQLMHAVPHYVVSAGRVPNALGEEGNELRAIGGEDSIRQLSIEESLTQTDAVPAEEDRCGRDECTHDGNDVRPACKLFGGCDPRLPAESAFQMLAEPPAPDLGPVDAIFAEESGDGFSEGSGM